MSLTRAGVNVAGGCLGERPTGGADLRLADDGPGEELGAPSTGGRAALLRPTAELALHCTR